MKPNQPISSLYLAPDSDAGGGNPSAPEPSESDGNQNSVDPFAAIDFEMLDDETAARIKEAQSKYQEIQKNLQGLQNKYGQLEHFARTKQSELDKIKARFQNKNGSEEHSQEEDEPFDVVLKNLYIEEGLNPVQAEAAARLQAKVLKKHAEILDKRFSSVVGQVGKTAAASKAELTFHAVRSTNEFLSDPELAQEVWESIENLVEHGQPVTPELVSNLADLKAMKRLKEGKMKLPEKEQKFQINQQSRLSFPGAGHTVHTPEPRQSSRPLDPETAAAVQATIAHWPKPKK